MAKRKKVLDSRQLELDYTHKVDEFVAAKQGLLDAIDAPTAAAAVESEFEACVEIAASVKRAMRESGIKREEMVERINAYFGRTEEGAKAEPPTCRKPLSIHMFNHFLSKPIEYPLEAYYLFAIQRITGSLEPARVLVAPEGAKVISGAQVRQMQLGQLEETMAEMRRIMKALRDRRSMQ